MYGFSFQWYLVLESTPNRSANANVNRAEIRGHANTADYITVSRHWGMAAHNTYLPERALCWRSQRMASARSLRSADGH